MLNTNKDPAKLLFKALKNNRNDQVQEIMTQYPELINRLINDDNTMTPIMVTAYYNAFYCTKTILSFNPDLTMKQKNEEKDAYFLAAERDNIYVLQDLWEFRPREEDLKLDINENDNNNNNNDESNDKNKTSRSSSKRLSFDKNEMGEELNDKIKPSIDNKTEDVVRTNNFVSKDEDLSIKEKKLSNSQIKESNKYDYSDTTTLDWAILNMCYRCAFFLHCEKGLSVKDVDFYLQKRNSKLTSKFNFPLFVECLKKRTPRGETPNFYLSQKQKRDLENYLPDPNETWPAFYKRMLTFELYQPPLVHKDTIPIEKKNTTYMKMQTKLVEMEYNTKSKLFYYNVIIFILIVPSLTENLNSKNGIREIEIEVIEENNLKESTDKTSKLNNALEESNSNTNNNKNSIINADIDKNKQSIQEETLDDKDDKISQEVDIDYEEDNEDKVKKNSSNKDEAIEEDVIGSSMKLKD